MSYKGTEQDYENFKTKIELFVDEHFTAEGCRECNEQNHPIVPDDWNPRGVEESSYDKALKILFNDFIHTHNLHK